jgi:hypothetical protein
VKCISESSPSILLGLLLGKQDACSTFAWFVIRQAGKFYVSWKAAFAY